jgi:hypothetical protein
MTVTPTLPAADTPLRVVVDSVRIVTWQEFLRIVQTRGLLP